MKKDENVKKDMIIRFKLDVELGTQIREYCKENDMKISYFLIVAAREYMKNHPTEEK